MQITCTRFNRIYCQWSGFTGTATVSDDDWETLGITPEPFASMSFDLEERRNKAPLAGLSINIREYGLLVTSIPDTFVLALEGMYRSSTGRWLHVWIERSATT